MKPRLDLLLAVPAMLRKWAMSATAAAMVRANLRVASLGKAGGGPEYLISSIEELSRRLKRRGQFLESFQVDIAPETSA